MIRLSKIFIFCFLSLGLITLILYQFVVDKVRDGINDNILFERLVSHMKVYKVDDYRLMRVGRDYDGGYVLPEVLIAKSEALLSYGIADDSSFEEDYSTRSNKPSYGFDCGISQVKTRSKLFTFYSECIGTDEYLYKKQQSSKRVGTFSSHIEKLNLSHKKVLVKMDIEGAEFSVIPEIIKNPNIVGLIMELHIWGADELKKAINLLKEIDKDYVLTHVHGNNYASSGVMTRNSIGYLPILFEMTYVSKKIINNWKLSDNQKHPTSLDMPNIRGKKELEFEILVN